MLTYLGKIGELMLKGANLHSFEKLLMQNTKYYLQSVEAAVELRAGRLYIKCPEESAPAVEFTLSHLLGITGWAKAQVVEKNIDAIKEEVLKEALNAKEKGAKTFKVFAKRGDKSFPLNSYEIMKEAGAAVFDRHILEVDVHKPDVTITVEIREQCFVYADDIKGNRGLPLGSSGRGLLLLSGGLDSPVAGYRMMRRGMKIDTVYFHSYPYTSQEAQEKVEKLAEILSSFGLTVHLNIIPFTEVQMQIKKKAPENFSTLMLRMCMVKCANMVAERIGADCLVTGESLGQVASQTIENMNVTESAAEFPLLRPLVGLDKEEIVETAKFIGTYETSILPYEDCCVLFSPKHPVLRADLEESKKIYEGMDIDELVKKAYENRTVKRFEAPGIVARDFGTNSKKEKLALSNNFELKKIEK